jgi:hypothetical protein
MPDASAVLPDKPRVLFFARSCDGAGMIAELAQRSDAYFIPAHPDEPVPAGMKLFTLGTAWRLRRAIREGRYNLVVSCSNPEPVWRADRGVAANLFKFIGRLLGAPNSLGFYLIPWMLAESGLPLAVFDGEDNTIIARKNWRLLKRATCYFKTQSPRNPYKAFLFQDKRNDCLFNIVRQPQYAALAEKLQPCSVGITLAENGGDLSGAEKQTDVFFAGAAHPSSTRFEGVRHLEELREEGYRIDLHVTAEGENPLPRPEFRRRCAEAWLVWSPEGADGDRAYEAPVTGSVPLLNLPEVRRYRPLLDGVHGFYYGVEGDDIKRAVRLALQDKERLRQMAREGDALVREFHTHRALADYMIAETLTGAIR